MSSKTNRSKSPAKHGHPKKSTDVLDARHVSKHKESLTKKESSDKKEVTVKKATVSEERSLYDLDTIIANKMSAENNFRGGGKKINNYMSSTVNNGASNGTPNKNSIIVDEDKAPIEYGDSERHEKILQSYVEIPKSTWGDIELDTYIRYIGMDGQLKTGARIKNITEQPDGSLSISLCRRSFGSKKGYFWTANTSKINKIYRFIDRKEDKKGGESGSYTGAANSNVVNNPPPNHTNGNDLLDKIGEKLLFEDAETLRNKIDTFDTRLQKVEGDIARILNMIHHIGQKLKHN